MPTGAVGSFPLEGTTFELDFTTDENLPSSLPSTPPRHHRTSSISDSPACSINGGSNDSAAGGATSSSSGLLNPAGSSLHGGSSNSSNNGSSSGSDAGATTGGGGIAGSRQVAFGGLSMMPLELPDFASMLPSESSFTESSVDDAAAPTPHTPVVLSVFEGEGIKAASARSANDAAASSSANSTHHNFLDEFDSIALEVMMPNGSSSSSTHNDGSYRHHGVHHPELHQLQQEGWEPPQFSSLLARRTLSAVMEVEYEGLDEDTHALEEQHQQEEEQEHKQEQLRQPQQVQQQEQLDMQQQQSAGDGQQQQAATTALQESRQQHIPQAGGLHRTGPGALQASAVDESGVELELVSGELFGRNSNSSGDRSCRTSNSSSTSSSTSMLLSMPPDIVEQHSLGRLEQQQQQLVTNNILSLAEQQQQQQQLMEPAPPPGAGNAPSPLAAAAAAWQGSLDSLDSLETAAVELRVCSRGCAKPAEKLAECKQMPGSVASAAAAAAAAAGVAAAAGGGDGAAAAAAGEEDEWAAANRERLRELQQQEAAAFDPTMLSSLLTAYPQAEAALLAADMRCHRASVLQSLPPHSSWLACKLQQLLVCGACAAAAGGVTMAEGSPEHEQLVLLLSLAKTGLSDSNEVHLGILQAVYCTLTGKCQPVPRYGHHWGDVGFQGDDPATDLRGVGMLGLLQLLYLPHHNAAAAQKLYQLSISSRQEFPLAIVSLNISRWTLMALRAGALAAHARRCGSYTAAANQFYCGAFYEFYARWCQGKTMREAGFVLKQLEEHCRRHPAKLLQVAAAPGKAIAAADRASWQPM